MAFDTVARRLSLLPGSMPLPDGELDAGDRQHLLDLARIPFASGMLTGHLLGLLTFGPVVESERLSVAPTLSGQIALAPAQDGVHA